MDKKMTRRVVLGTLIGGLAAGPFVMRALRKKRGMVTGPHEVPVATDIDIPPLLLRSKAQQKLFHEWKKEIASLEIIEKPLQGMKFFRLEPRLPDVKKQVFTHIGTNFQGKIGHVSEATQENLAFFTKSSGVMRLESQQLSTRLDRNHMKSVEFLGNDRSEIKVDRFDLESCVLERVNDSSCFLPTNDSIFASWIQHRLQFNLPQKEFSVHDTFSAEIFNFPGIRFDIRVENPVIVNNVEAAKFTLHKVFAEDDFASYEKKTGAALLFDRTELLEPDVNLEDLSEEQKIHLEAMRVDAAQENYTAQQATPLEVSHQAVFFIDLSTGLTIHQEEVTQTGDNTMINVFHTT